MVSQSEFNHFPRCISTEPGLTAVHCSAGVGRTGTFIALWNLLDEAAARGGVDVADAVRRMREFRFKMVQTADQYVFIYRTLAIALRPELRPMDFPRLRGCDAQKFAAELFPTLGALTGGGDFRRPTKASTSPQNVAKNRFTGGPHFHDDARGKTDRATDRRTGRRTNLLIEPLPHN